MTGVACVVRQTNVYKEVFAVRRSWCVLALLMAGVFVVGAGYEVIDGRVHVVFGARQPVEILDPAIHYDWSTRMVQEAVYDALLKYVDDPPTLEPWLAESWDVSDDAVRWTFYLVRDAEFHNGDPVTAEAVRYSFERILALQQGPAWMLEGVLTPEGIEVVDDYTIRFHLEKPYAPFASMLPWWYIVNPNVVQAQEVDGDWGSNWLREPPNTAGSGPFEIREWEHGAYYWLQAREDYWKGWPHPDHIGGLIFQLIREPASQRMAIEAGDACIVEGVTSRDFTVLAEKPGIYVSQNPGMTTFGLKMNTQGGMTANPMIRKAVAYAYDYDAFVDIYEGQAVLMDSPFPMATKGYVSLEDWMYHQDFDKAREYLEMAGYPGGGFELEYVYVAGFEEERLMGLVLRECLAEIGVGVKMVPLTWPEMVERGSRPETSPDLMAVFTTPVSNDPDAIAIQYHPMSTGSYFYSHFLDNPRVNYLVEEARATGDWEDRAPMYEEFQRLVLYEATEIFGMLYDRRWALRDYVQGFRFCPLRMTSEIDMYYLYVDEDRLP